MKEEKSTTELENCTQRNEISLNTPVTPKPVTPQEIIKELENWKWQSTTLRFIHSCLGIIAIFSSLIVASKVQLFLSTDIFAFLAALSIGVINGFDLGAKSNRMRTAWRKLNSAVLSYENCSDYTITELIKAYEQSEEIIGDVKENPK